MTKYIKILKALLILTLITSCDALHKKNKPQIEKPLQYLKGADNLEIDQFLRGNLEGFAIVQNSRGKIMDSLLINVNGNWEKNKGTVKFVYKFNNGETDSRTWLITVDDREHFTAIGHDFISPAKGRQSGNVGHINYVLSKGFANRLKDVKFSDDIYLVDKNSAIITSTMIAKEDKSKEKIVGKLIISLSKKSNNISTKKIETNTKAEIKKESNNSN